MVNIRGRESGKIEKPPPKIKGGRKPKDSGRRYEREFASKYGFQRVVGSGAFGNADPNLKGDVKGVIGRLKLLIETKTRRPKLLMRGTKTVSFPLHYLTKIGEEAESMGMEPLFIFHLKGSSEEWACVKWDWLHKVLLEQEEQIAQWERDYDQLRNR